MKSPKGLSGKARQAFLALTEAQQAVYLAEWEKGHLAAHCLRIAITGSL